MRKNENGFTLIELIAAISLSSIIFIGFTMFMIQYVVEFKEIKEYNVLQEEVLKLFEIMRKGKIEDRINKERYLIGMETANKITLFGNKSIRLEPYDLYAFERNEVEFREEQGRIRYTAFYGSLQSSLKYAFPSPEYVEEKIDKEPKYKITEFKIEKINQSNNLYKVSVKAQVRFRPRQSDQDKEDDIRINTKSISFETTVYASNAK